MRSPGAVSPVRRARKASTVLVSSVLVAGGAFGVVAAAGSASAADLNKDFEYTCNVVASGLSLGDHLVGVNAKVSVPDEVEAGTTIEPRKTQITLTMPETLRSATVGLLGAKQASGFSDDASISLTAEGVSDTFTYDIANLAADWVPVPQEAGAKWTIPTEGDVPAIEVPSADDYPDLTLPTDAVIHMPASFNVTASLKNAAGELIGGEGAVSMACSINGDDDVFGTVSIVEGDGGGDPDPGDPDPGDPDPGEGEQQLEVVVPESDGPTEPGEFTWAIDGSNDIVDLGTAEENGDHFAASGAINPVRVTDTRAEAPEWSISAQVGDFASGEESFGGKYLGWTPNVGENDGGAEAGAAVASGFDGGEGLSTSSTLGSAAAGHALGSALLGADLDLKVPVDQADGTYKATLTLTALS